MPSTAISAGPLCWTISQRSVCRRKATGVSKSKSSPNFKSSIETRARSKKSVGFRTCGISLRLVHPSEARTSSSTSGSSAGDLAQTDQAGLNRAGRAAVSASDRGHGFAAFELAYQNLLFGCVPCLARLRQFTRLFPRRAAPQGRRRCLERLYRVRVGERTIAG